MKRPGFLQGALLALGLAVLASVMFAALMPFVGTTSVLRLLVPLLAFAYLVYLLKSSDEATGRVTTIAVWGIAAVTTWWAAPPLPLYLLIHAAIIWLVRSLYFYSSALSALIDLALTALGAAAFAWAAGQTGSLFLATWSLFLTQALFVAIPPRIGSTSAARPADNAAFERARRQADAALATLMRH